MWSQDICRDGPSDQDYVSQSHRADGGWESPREDSRPDMCFSLSPHGSPQLSEAYQHPRSSHDPAGPHVEHRDPAGDPQSQPTSWVRGYQGRPLTPG